MKQLQNNFTTPEQSKRLLELGVPADSADCYYRDFASSRVRLIPNIREMDDKFGIDTNFLIPCWSVGRLIEILCICERGEEVSFYTWTDKVDLVEWVIFKIEVAEPDFSKLED